ncbi:phosphotransferase [Vagococcus carniphilus]|uniref:phosphotransferase n=1 Tax=Vagococcus carniphilus TaxID=218144 RepID=UPI00288ED2F1|nr:phosphotransferase [Vagococcus carniphilus]MDT2832231.1 phosphotransferase [Vagococcus carniphilus]MDT2840685.1 phosphotransferase [Vagococcus carniphilus]MDT2855703.1 phosphotransferase [Vagococcus carniphilus]
MDKSYAELLTGLEVLEVSPFFNERLDKEYQAYRLATREGKSVVLKKVSKEECDAYQLLNRVEIFPEFINQTKDSSGDYWLTTEYFLGKDLSILKKEAASRLGKELAKLANSFFEENDSLRTFSPNLKKQIESKYQLLEKLKSNLSLYKTYEEYIIRFKGTPKTICHDDLLPINVLFDEKTNQMKILDLEHVRLSSYICDVARFGAFYSGDKVSFKKGFSFFDEEENIQLFLKTYYSFLMPKIETQFSFDQFMQDYHLECLNQYLLNISYLEKISEKVLKTDWEFYFYQLATERVGLVNKGRKK